MTTIRAALYARVSSEQQAAAHTIESQRFALTERARNDGTPVPPERQFVDDGISGPLWLIQLWIGCAIWRSSAQLTESMSIRGMRAIPNGTAGTLRGGDSVPICIG